MPVMRGADEVEAARLTLEFFNELATKFQKYHSKFIFPTYRFRGLYSRYPWEDSKEADSLSGNFAIQAKSKKLAYLYPKNSIIRRRAGRGDWVTVGTTSFWRADMDDSPEMRSVVFCEFLPQIFPPFFREEMRKFTKDMFGCDDISFVRSVNEEEELDSWPIP